jgi:hypothetical protein
MEGILGFLIKWWPLLMGLAIVILWLALGGHA